MPSVRTRRSTRVFVPKQPQLLAAGDENEWLKVLRGVDGDGPDLKRWWKAQGKNGWKEEREEIEKGIEEKKLFGAVYSRKRRRSTPPNDVNKDRKFGIVFERKHRRKQQKVWREATDDGSKRRELRVREFGVVDRSKTLAEKLGVLDSDLCSGLECGPFVLAVLLDSSVGYSSDRFERLLVSIMNWIRRARVELMDLVAFLFGRSIGSVFSLNGIHFLPIRHKKNRILNINSVSGCGFCKIYGARELVPLLSVDYSALPSYFKFLHAIIILGSQYLPRIPRTLCLKHLVSVIETSLMVVTCEKHIYSDNPLDMEISGTAFTVSETPSMKRDDNTLDMEISGTDFTVSETPSMKRDELPTLGGSRNPVIINGSRLRKHKRKRSSLTNSRARNLSSMISRFGSFRSRKNSYVSSTAKRNFAVTPVNVKPLDSCLSDLFSDREESDSMSSPGSFSNLRKSAGMKSPVEKTTEMRFAMAEVRQNIDSACCNANLLVIDTEKCWREDGAQVMLEMSSSHVWFIAVKRGDMMRFMHKPQDLKPCVVNRFTHAYMWSGDDGWKLEFCDKWDWHVFKELHMECRDRNTQEVSAKVIPVPGVREVSGYENDTVPSFIRPDSYIHMMDDEVGRALASEISYYDMDSADGEWLRNLNSGLSDAQGGGSSYVSEENFERIIFALEKDAYSCHDDASDKERALNLCQELATRDMVSPIYDYWFKKRKQKHAPLTRMFQGPPLRRTQLIQKPFFRKKRSFNRQRSQGEWNQAGRGKPDLFLQAHQESVRKVQEAEAAVSRAADIATELRTRAQFLMSNADLAAYKAAMALRIAETIRVSSLSSSSESPDLDSSILFD